MQQLKPCPFCGKEPKLYKNEQGYWRVDHNNRKCFIDYVDFNSEKIAMAEWNKRIEDKV